ncbi:MAG TPA: TIGR03084 family metal-binding protein [Pilimelia sp.]|nr:TIGR03084 family metal-binding protein [Pilimelia sp.]
MIDIATVLTDLADESADLDATVAELSDPEWVRLTPAVGWTIGHQIAHLAWTDHVALLSTTDAGAFARALASATDDPTAFIDRGAAEFLAPPAELLARWRAGRTALAEALAAAPAEARLPWLGTTMSPAGMATGRIMETWAHGQDVADTLGISRTPTNRLRHVAFLGVRTLGHSFLARGSAAPTEPVRVELTAPGGEQWTYGPEDAANRVVGPAWDFCLLVTQRRHRSDVALVATGPVADEWLNVAQAFAGPPGTGREPAAAMP